MAGEAARGATAYVTLEPYAGERDGGNGADALIAAGIARVVTAIPSPDPRTTGAGHAALEKAGIAVTTNVLGAVNQFEAAVRRGVARLFYASKPNVWLNTYSITKAAAEQFAALYNQRGETRICALRYYNAFGPHQSLVPIRKIIPMFASLAMRGRPLEVFGDGQQIVDLVYSRDLARVTVQFLASEHTHGVVDCGRGVGLSVNDVAAAVNAVTGNQAGVRHLPMRRGEDELSVLVADLEVLTKLVRGIAFTDLETSLADTIEWYRRLPSEQVDRAVASLCA